MRGFLLRGVEGEGEREGEREGGRERKRVKRSGAFCDRAVENPQRQVTDATCMCVSRPEPGKNE